MGPLGRAQCDFDSCHAKCHARGRIQGPHAMGEVSLVDVSKRFTLRVDGAVQVVEALRGVSFTVKDGEIVALIGPSGCGKTTALRIAMGLETASTGKVTVDGREVKGCGFDRGMVFQFAELLPWLTAQ